MKLFSVDGPLFKFFDRLWDIIKLNFIWLICSIPIVTFGPATVAAFSITLHMADDTEGYIVKPFFKAFKENMKKGIPLGLLFLGATYCLYLYTQLIMKAKSYQGIIMGLGIVLFVIYVDMFMYAFALLARYENSLIKTIHNSYKISMKFNLRTILLTGIVIVEIALFAWNSILMVIGLLIAPTLIMLTISGFALYIFKKIEKEQAS